MIEYTIKKTIVGKKRIRVLYSPEFSDSSMQILSVFLGSEYKNFREEIEDALDAAMNGRSDHTEFAGNSILIRVTPDTTTLEYTLDKADMPPYTLPSIELKELIDRWNEDIRNLKKN